MTQALSIFLYSISLNVVVQAIAILFSAAAYLTQDLFYSVALLSLAVSIFSNLIEHRVAIRLSRNSFYQRYLEHREQIEKVFKGKSKTVYLIGLIKVFKNGIYFEFSRNISLLFKVFLFIPAYIFLNEQVKEAAISLPQSFLWNIEPYSVFSVGGVHVLPFIMFLISVISGLIYHEKGRSKISQHIGMSLLFLILLYPSKSILVIYWCMNISFSTAIQAFMKSRL